jgi:hypothetical protein
MQISTDATIILQHVRGKEYLEDQRVEGKILKRIFKRYNGADVH